MTTDINGIDVSECCFYNNGKCDNPNGMACNCINNAVCYFKELKRLQEENEELKSLNDFNVQKIEVLQEENEKLKEEKDGMQIVINNYIEHTTKYRQALEKIIDIAEKLITETPEYNSCYYKDECGNNCTPKKQSKVEYCCYENVDKILTIINEALNDRN